MRYFSIAAMFLVAMSGCKKAEKAAEAAKEVQQAPVQYVNDLQKDMQKAEAAKDKANANTQQMEQTLAEGESQSR